MWPLITTLSSWHHDTVCQTLYTELTRLENLVISSTVPVCCVGIHRTVKMDMKFNVFYNERNRIGFPFPLRPRVTCTCRVSAVGVRLMTIQCFDKFKFAFLLPYQYNCSNWLNIKRRERDDCRPFVCQVFHSCVFETWKKVKVEIKNTNTNILFDWNPSVLWRSNEKHSESDETLYKHYRFMLGLLESWKLFTAVRCQTCIDTYKLL